jgi:hypothetical protein
MIHIHHSYNREAHISTSKSPFEKKIGYFPPSPLDVVYGEQGGVRENLTRDALQSEKNVENISLIHLQVHHTLRKSQEKYKARHDQQKIERKFIVGDRIWLQLNKERLEGPSKKIKDLWYGPFEVVEKVGDNSYRFSLPPYMHIYSVVNVENLKLYEPPMLDQED